ncbi:hypothetical protein diail_11240 [Diaporthe ilicicola]|nr:hypothetical protein diail_11240 [Diaporthe ilicicola]
MEGCTSNKFVDFFHGCLGGGQKTQEPMELTSRSNTYGQKLKEALENKGGQRANSSKPLPPNPPGRASLDLSKARHPSGDLTDLVDGGDEHVFDRAWYEMLQSLHNALKHTRYSISGRHGMSVWGCANGAKSGLSIICPIESQKAIKIWCISTSGRFNLTEDEPDILTFQTPATNRSVSRTWRIKIRWLREATFDAMHKVEVALRYDDGNPYAGEQFAVVNVLTLPALLDNCASAWVGHHRKHTTPGSRLRGLEEDIFSILQRIRDLHFAEEGAGPLTEAECRHVCDSSFWKPFTEKHPDSPALFALCGLPLPQTPTMAQPAPNAGMVYPADHRFSDPRPAPAVPPKAKGRDLTSNVKRRSEPEPTRPEPKQPIHRPSFMDLFSPTVRKEGKAAQAERERRRSEDARKLEQEMRRERRHRDSKKRSSTPSSSRRPRPSLNARTGDQTKVSAFDPSVLEAPRIPARGFFADLVIEDDGEAL